MKRFSVFLVIGALLLFGCTTQYSADYNASVNGTSGQQNATHPSGGQPSGTAVNTTPPAGTSAPAANNKSGTGATVGADISGKNYSDLLLLGTSSECSVSYLSKEHTYNLNVFFDGKGAMRIEDHSTGSQECQSNALVFKGDIANGGAAYMACPSDKEALGNEFATENLCDWLSTNVSSEWGGIGSFSWGIDTYSTLPLDMVPQSGYKCMQWVADASKFDTSGHICYQ